MGKQDTMNKNTKKNRRIRTKQGATPLTVMPAQARTVDVKFDYQLNLTLTEAAAGTGDSYAFRLNSLYDPNATGVGSQPVGYDQWMALFNRSVVYGCNVQIEMVTAGTLPQQMGVYPLIGASSLPGTPAAWPSQFGAQASLCGVTGQNRFQHNKYYDIAKMFGISRAKLLSEEEYSESPAGPAVAGNNQCFLYVWVRGIGAVGITAASIKLSLVARLYDPLCLSVS